jgi:hypothetical protein
VVTLVISDELTVEEREEVLRKVMRYLTRELRAGIGYSINLEGLPEAEAMRYYQMEWALDLGDQETMAIQCSSLNAFVFGCEMENAKFRGPKFAIFLPKSSEEVLEILVDIKAHKFYHTVNHSLLPFSAPRLLAPFADMISSIQHYFPHQRYIVFYCDRAKKKLVSTVYVYSKKEPSALVKYKYEDHKIKSEHCSVDFTFVFNELKRYRYTTHRDYVPKLKESLA